ncbi:PREDICTED: uncharacterized protein LOC106785562 [Polistes canadensis]|uniref:uncharacterized protein LOC106785562 n=1 Tax=Polistes canadensis TaxID=91411 RepID=UPI000718E8CE|nr:PREDICTED: uncharacterized protein LOC106785562 [Polistes canadensis]
MARSIVSGRNVLLVFNLVLLCLFADAEKYKDIIQESSGGLPFLQFTNDGVRVNFAGYHAEAGLGGLLGNSKTGGGLHASAGTPFGPQASAGLGGLLSGDNANTGGGLFAQAGLGNNRPSARAGLGGILDGSGKSNHAAAGGLFAGADLGNNQPGAQAGLGGVLDGNSNTPNDNNVPNITPTSHTNIQILSKSATRGHKNQRAIDTKSIITNEAVPESKYDDVNGQNAVENVQNIPIVQPGNNDLVSAKGVAEAEANVDAAIANNYWASQQQPFISRWYLRKILRGNPFRKQMIQTSSVIPVSESELDTSSSTAFDAVSDKSSEEKIGYADSNINYDSFKKYKPEFVYNDDFNIPIST